MGSEAGWRVVISEGERRLLNRIERHIGEEDPRLVRQFATGFVHSRPRRWPYTTVLVIAISVVMVGLIFALAAITLVAFLVAAAAAFGRWSCEVRFRARRRRERE